MINRHRYLIIFFVLFFSNIFNCKENKIVNLNGERETETETLFRIKKNGRWGYINKVGKIIIEPIYDMVYDFNNDRAAVRKDSKWGFINKKGEVVIQIKYSGVRFFSEGRAAVKEVNKKYKVIDESGNDITDYTFTDIYSFKEGLACVVNEKNKFGYIDRNGKLVIPYQFDFYPGLGMWKTSGYSFHDGYAIVLKNEKNTVINKKGEVVIGAQFDVFENFINGFFSVKKSGKYGIIDEFGNTIIPIIYDYCSNFNKENDFLYAVAGNNGKLGMINVKGDYFVKPDFDKLNWYYEGLATFGILKNIDNPISNKRLFYGSIDRDGKIIIPAIFSESYSFSEGLAFTRTWDMKNGYSKFGYIDKTGKYVIEQKFDYAQNFKDDIAQVFIGDEYFDEDDFRGKMGYINKNGEYIWEPSN